MTNRVPWLFRVGGMKNLPQLWGGLSFVNHLKGSRSLNNQSRIQWKVGPFFFINTLNLALNHRCLLCSTSSLRREAEKLLQHFLMVIPEWHLGKTLISKKTSRIGYSFMADFCDERAIEYWVFQSGTPPLQIPKFQSSRGWQPWNWWLPRKDSKKI